MFIMFFVYSKQMRTLHKVVSITETVLTSWLFNVGFLFDVWETFHVVFAILYDAQISGLPSSDAS